MMKMWLVPAMSLAVFACSSDDPEPANETIGKEIADDYNEALDKAANVENQLMEQNEKIKEALREAENAPQDP